MMRRRKESGFALLLVFLMAAVVAITLYMEIPRVAFETQRQREELLIERGHEYQRAIQEFVSPTGVGRWPASIDELESTNSRRFLRHRYVDPMTGKDDWRLVHIQNGMLTDSVTTKKKTAESTDTTAGQYVGEHPGLGQDSAQQGAAGVNLAQRRRASDTLPNGAYPGTQGANNGGAADNQGTGDNNATQPIAAGIDPTQPPMNPDGTPATPGAAGPAVPGQVFPAGLPGAVIRGGMPGITGAPGAPGMPGGIGAQPAQGTSEAGSSGSAYVGGGYSIGSQSPQSNQVGQPPAGMPGIPGVPGQVANPMGGGQQPYQAIPGVSSPVAGFGPGMSQQGQRTAADLIGDILGHPRPAAPSGGMGAGGGTVNGGGVAGVASKFDSDSIMVYSDRTNYAEWEFIFDPTKVRPPPNPLTGAGVPAAQMADPTFGKSAPGTPASQLGSQPGQNQNQGQQPITSFGQGQH